MLNNKVVVITGGAGLLGMVFSDAILRAGGNIIIADLDDRRGEESTKELQNLYGDKRVLFVKTDITSVDSIKQLLGTGTKKYNKIDALVNNAYPRNKNYGRHFFDVEYSDFCTNVNMHLGGYFLMCQQFSKYFKETQCGNIVNISSIYGVIPPRFEIYQNTQMTMPVEYAVIKSALIHLTKYIAKYLSGSNVRINSLSPGGILDNQPEAFIDAYKKFTTSKGMLEKNDIVGTLVFLLSDASKYINGQNIVVDDGFSL